MQREKRAGYVKCTGGDFASPGPLPDKRCRRVTDLAPCLAPTPSSSQSLGSKVMETLSKRCRHPASTKRACGPGSSYSEQQVSGGLFMTASLRVTSLSYVVNGVVHLLPARRWVWITTNPTGMAGWYKFRCFMRCHRRLARMACKTSVKRPGVSLRFSC
jgi:hypothetical protein